MHNIHIADFQVILIHPIYCTLIVLPSEASSLLKSSKVGGAETGHRVPSSSGREPVGVAARVRSALDVVERAGVGVQEGVEEPKGALPGGDEAVVDQGHDRCEDGTGAARAIDALERTVDNDLEVGTNSSDVGEGTAGGVELAAVGGSDGAEVALDDGGLV